MSKSKYGRFFSYITGQGEQIAWRKHAIVLDGMAVEHWTMYEDSEEYKPSNLLAEALKEDGYEDIIYCSDGTVLKVTCKATETPDHENHVMYPYHMAWDFSLVEKGKDFDFISRKWECEGGNFSTKEVNFKDDLEWVTFKSSMSPNDFLTMPNR